MIIYDFSYKTGDNLWNSSSPKEDTCLNSSFNSSVFLGSDHISGLNYTKLSCNGQVLVEQASILIPAGFEEVYLNSGDYYFKSGESYQEAFLDSEFAINDPLSFSFFYNLRDVYGEPPVATGSSSSEKTSGIRSAISQRFPDRTGTITGLSSFEYFANGQKIYSGISSGSYRISGSPPLFYYDDTYSGKIFAIPKNTGIKNNTGIRPDIYGEKFVESTVFGYLNGGSLHRKNWLELSTGVILLQTGIQALIFDEEQLTESIIL